jgi:hypothetical protein
MFYKFTLCVYVGGGGGFAIYPLSWIIQVTELQKPIAMEDKRTWLLTRAINNVIVALDNLNSQNDSIELVTKKQ